MNEYQTLYAILAEAIRTAQQKGFDPAAPAESAAKAFRAGLAAFDAPIPSTELTKEDAQESMGDCILNAAGYGVFSLQAASQHLRVAESRISNLEEKLNRRPVLLDRLFVLLARPRTGTTTPRCR